MKNISAIHLGHSHLAALTPALYNRQPNTSSTKPPITHYMFNTASYNIFGSGEEKFRFSEKRDGIINLNQIILRNINQAVDPESNVIIITMYGGNTHNAITMLEVPGGIDFVLPNRLDLPMVEGATVIPYGLIRDIVLEQCKDYLIDLQGTRNATSGRVIHVVSPPPIEDNTYLSEVISRDPYFSQLGHNRITPKIVRYKMWLLHTEIHESLCKDLNIEVLYPPESCFTSGKWLSPDCIGPDPTHGNIVYGERVLQQIENTIDGRFNNWAWLG